VAALAEIQTASARNELVESSKQTVEEYLTNSWLPIQRRDLRESTAASYEANLRLHVIPWIGQTRLQALETSALDRLYSDLLDHGRRSQRGGLSHRTVRYIHTILRKALNDAARKRLITSNPADYADPPSSNAKGRKEMRTWTAPELRQFLDHVEVFDDRLQAAWILAASTGMRRGEVLGLRWMDVDLEEAQLSVRQTVISIAYQIQVSRPKSEAGRRSIALDAKTIKALRGHKRRQLEERFAWGPAWEDSGLIFTRPDGGLIHPDGFSKRFGRLVSGIGLPRISLHNLRHTHATIMLEAGIHPKVVQERLGHKSIQITLDTYSHIIPSMQRGAADQIGELLFGDSKRNP
jgi:integrase